MESSHIALLLVTFMVVMCMSVAVRVKSKGEYEVKPIDVIIGLIPFIIWLLVSGKLTEFSVGDLSVKLREASQSSISTQVSNLRENEDVLHIGVGCDYGVEKNMKSLETFPTFRPYQFIVIEECENDYNSESYPIFVGMLSVEDYKDHFLGNTKLDVESFFRNIKMSQFSVIDNYNIPSYISVTHAVTPNTKKLRALQIVDRLNVEALPVISDEGEFIGIVSRSRLVTSFVVDIVEFSN
ncbi:MAG: CBS domain-containing protein [Photobacterium frigidiphilum]|uniref:CBS domain-containing protein n=1 Tax=Photobacterium frigidiphilum TaxID=264736 RepID=UPI0030032FA2